MSELNKTRKNLAELVEKRGKLMEKLNASLDLQEEFPDAFEHGQVKTTVRGKLGFYTFSNAGIIIKQFLNLDFVVMLGDGTEIVKKVSELKNQKLALAPLSGSHSSGIIEIYDFDAQESKLKVRRRKALEKKKEDYFKHTP